MKKHAFFLLASATALACSSDPENPAQGGAGMGGTNQSAAGSGGAAAGTNGSVAGSSTGGSVTSGGSAGNAATGGAGAATGGAGSGGAAGGAGAGGAAGAAGSGGSGGGSAGSGGAVDPGNLPNMIPQAYTGKPFGGTPQTIPGKIEIEKYDTGGAGVAFQADKGGDFNKCGFTRAGDALKLQCTQQQGSPEDLTLPGCGHEPEGSIYLGYIGAGNWYKYTVNVTQAGTYVISGHEGVAGNTQMQFTFTDAVKTAPLTLPSTDKCNHEAYHVWETQNNLGEITLQPGKYVLTITVVAAAMNLDWFAFTKK